MHMKVSSEENCCVIDWIIAYDGRSDKITNRKQLYVFICIETEKNLQTIFLSLFSLFSIVQYWNDVHMYLNVGQFLVNILNSISVYSFMQNEYGTKE